MDDVRDATYSRRGTGMILPHRCHRRITMIALLQSLKEDLHQYLIAPSEPFRDPQWSLRHPACHSACLHVQIFQQFRLVEEH
jgi:hypothetical protein